MSRLKSRRRLAKSCYPAPDPKHPCASCGKLTTLPLCQDCEERQDADRRARKPKGPTKAALERSAKRWARTLKWTTDVDPAFVPWGQAAAAEAGLTDAYRQLGLPPAVIESKIAASLKPLVERMTSFGGAITDNRLHTVAKKLTFTAPDDPLYAGIKQTRGRPPKDFNERLDAAKTPKQVLNVHAPKLGSGQSCDLANGGYPRPGKASTGRRSPSKRYEGPEPGTDVGSMPSGLTRLPSRRHTQ